MVEDGSQPRPAVELHRLLLRVQCVELAGSAAAGGSDDHRVTEDEEEKGGGGVAGAMLSPRQHRRRALLGEGVCEVVALVDTTARAICRYVSERIA
jgi:uncharacterized spore protein YtfJ